MLSWRQEEGSVDEWISVEDVEDGLAEHAGNAVHLVGGVARQDEDPSLVVPDAALVLHLQIFKYSSSYFVNSVNNWIIVFRTHP